MTVGLWITLWSLLNVVCLLAICSEKYAGQASCMLNKQDAVLKINKKRETIKKIQLNVRRWKTRMYKTFPIVLTFSGSFVYWLIKHFIQQEDEHFNQSQRRFDVQSGKGKGVVGQRKLALPGNRSISLSQKRPTWLRIRKINFKILLLLYLCCTSKMLS